MQLAGQYPRKKNALKQLTPSCTAYCMMPTVTIATNLWFKPQWLGTHACLTGPMLCCWFVAAAVLLRHGLDHLLLELEFPDDYPTRPFFARVVKPRCARQFLQVLQALAPSTLERLLCTVCPAAVSTSPT